MTFKTKRFYEDRYGETEADYAPDPPPECDCDPETRPRPMGCGKHDMDDDSWSDSYCPDCGGRRDE